MPTSAENRALTAAGRLALGSRRKWNERCIRNSVSASSGAVVEDLLEIICKLASHFEFRNWLSKSCWESSSRKWVLFYGNFSFRGEQGVHSLIYNASPQYVMMISSKSPEAIFVTPKRGKQHWKPTRCPRSSDSWNPLKLEDVLLKYFWGYTQSLN